jgi:NTP pyrophosphatase (non-canonical NTP hydrolase)
VSTDPIDELQLRIREFARERDWEQFHTPKNLAMALSGEVGELVEIFQWLTPEEAAAVMESPRAGDVEDELADVVIYLLRLADVLGERLRNLERGEAATAQDWGRAANEWNGIQVRWTASQSVEEARELERVVMARCEPRELWNVRL